MSKKKIASRAKSIESDLLGKRSLLGRFYAWLGIGLAKKIFNLNYQGQENIPEEIPYVIAPNHQTYIDGLLVGKGLPPEHFEKFSALIGSDLKTKHGLIGKLIVPVSRGVEVERYGNPVRGLVMARRATRAGNILMVHPEGTRTHNGLVASLQDGAAYIAIKSKIPLLPVYIEGGFEAFSRYDKWPRLKNPATGEKFKINLIYGEVLQPENFSRANQMTAALAAWYKEREKEYLVKNQGFLREIPEKIIDQEVKRTAARFSKN